MDDEDDRQSEVEALRIALRATVLNIQGLAEGCERTLKRAQEALVGIEDKYPHEEES